MAGEDEIIQKFRVMDDGAVQTLTAIDKETQQLRKSTEELGRANQEAGKKTGELTHHHMSARQDANYFDKIHQ